MTGWFSKMVYSQGVAMYSGKLYPEQITASRMEINKSMEIKNGCEDYAAMILGSYFVHKTTATKKTHRERDTVKRVIHNPPATIVFWKDKTKTVVKQQAGDGYDPEKGFMAACTKKFFGNDNQFNYEIKWHVPKQGPVKVDNSANLLTLTNVEFGNGTYSGPTC